MFLVRKLKRITEQFGLEKTFKNIQFQCPAICRDTFLSTRLLTAPASQPGLEEHCIKLGAATDELNRQAVEP